VQRRGETSKGESRRRHLEGRRGLRKEKNKGGGGARRLSLGGIEQHAALRWARCSGGSDEKGVGESHTLARFSRECKDLNVRTMRRGSKKTTE